MSNAELYEDMFAYDDENYERPSVSKTKKESSASYHKVNLKENTHIVIKREDVLKYLTEVEQVALENILNIISKERHNDGKPAFNSYYICNTDEPYAEVVYGVIIGGEAVKAKQAN